MKQRFSVFLIALLLALFIWMGIKLSATHKVLLHVPITISNAPAALSLDHIVPDVLDVTVEGTGKNLLLYTLNAQPYSIDLKDAHYGRNYYPIMLNKLSLFDEYKLNIVRTALNSQILIIMDNLIRKRVPVIVRFVDDDSRDFYKKNHIKPIPEYVWIKGPEKVLNQIASISPESFSEKQYMRSPTFSFEEKMYGKITVEQPKITFQPETTPVTHRVFSLVPISVSSDMHIFPSTVTIQVKGRSAVIDTLSAAQFQVTIDTTSITDQYVPLQLSYPHHVELVEYTPHTVRIKK